MINHEINKEESNLIVNKFREKFSVEIRKERNNDLFSLKRMKIINNYQNNEKNLLELPETTNWVIFFYFFSLIKFKKKEYIDSLINKFIGYMSDKNMDEAIICLKSIRHITCKRQEEFIYDLIVDSSLPTYLLNIIDGENPKLYVFNYESIWIFINICSIESSNTKKLIHLGIIPILMETLNTKELDILTQAIKFNLNNK